MADKYVIAIDAGSSGGRALIFDLRGNLISSASREWTYDVPDDAGPMSKEFAPLDFWEILCRLIKEAIGRMGIDPADVIAISSASQRQGVVFLDKDGRELYAGPNTDLRAILEGFTIDGEYGKEVYGITGHAPSLVFTPAKLHWFKANRPDIYKRITKAISISDWIIYKLSGEQIGEASCISSIGLVDIRDLQGSSRLEKMLDLPQKVCPDIVAAGTAVGPITKEAAEKTGLLPGTSVVVGGADSQCALLGMGVTERAQVGIIAGWSGSVQMVTAEPIIDSQGRTWSTCHVLPDRWILESNAQQCGGAYSWLKEILFGGYGSDKETYTYMDTLAAEVLPGAGGVIASIGPAIMDMSRMRPSLGGLLFPVTPSVADIKKEHLVRASLENLAFAFKANCVQLREISQLNIKEVKIGGGLAQSGCLVQILADVLDRPVHAFDVHHVTSWGTAMCAALGAGVYSSFESTIEAMSPQSRIIEPDQNAADYAQYYDKWLSTSAWLDKLSEDIW